MSICARTELHEPSFPLCYLASAGRKRCRKDLPHGSTAGQESSELSGCFLKEDETAGVAAGNL